ncbi:hypothetical protein [Streptomyces sp. NPDC051909]|uniref:hypothetical protein n=1 Tax=Streptomyces sp. NPDC051909 TaxID=3154944 RepID=UPI003434804F
MPRKRRRAKAKPSIPVPKEVILFPGRGRDGRGFALVDHNNGLYCCALRDLPGDTPLSEVQAAVDASVQDLVRALHGVEIALAWEPMDDSDSWLGRVTTTVGKDSPSEPQDF